MLYTIKQGNVQGYEGGQEPIIYLVTEAETVAAAGRAFVFTEGHAVIEFSRFFTHLGDLDQVDWDVMRSRYWYDTNEYPDRKRRRQAEFLVHRSVPWPLIREIGVRTDAIAQRVSQSIQFSQHVPLVTVRSDWYY